MTRPRRSLKKRRSEDNIDRRTKSITLEPVPGHRFPLIVIQLCVLIYMRTPCGLRTVVTILEIFAELLGDTFGKVPCYNTVGNWVKKLGLSVYQDEQPCKDKKFAMVVDESIAINGQKLLLTLAIPSEHQGPTNWTPYLLIQYSCHPSPYRKCCHHSKNAQASRCCRQALGKNLLTFPVRSAFL